MNFIKETDKHARALENWKKGHGFSDMEALKDLANIWDEFKNLPQRKAVIYGSSTAQPPKTDLSCASCVHDLLTFCINWRKLLENEVTVDFKGVPPAKVVVNNTLPDNIEDARKYLDLSGKKYHHKMKLPKLLELING